MTKYSLLCAALLTIAACGDSSESTTSDTQGTAVTDPIQPTLTAIQDIVLSAGERATDAEAVAEAIVAAYPTMAVSGSEVAADPTTISLFINLLNSKDVAGPDNPWVVAIAVMDSAGNCTGGGVHGFPLPTVRVETDSPTVCSASAVVDALDELV